MIARVAIYIPQTDIINSSGMIAKKATDIASQKVRLLQNKLYESAKANKKRTFGILYDKVYRMDVLNLAWEVVANKPHRSNSDKREIERITENGVDEYLKGIQDLLRSKTYRPGLVKRFYKVKLNGGLRPLGVPPVQDRIIQTAVTIVIEPIFEADFADFSYGFRPGKNTRGALKEIKQCVESGSCNIVEMDIEKCFDTIPHDLLMQAVKARIADKDVLKLIQAWLKCGVNDKGVVTYPTAGAVQGGVISPLLANVYLNALDQYWIRTHPTPQAMRDARLIRYADDFVIVCRRNPEYSLQQASRFLARLSLKVSKDKTGIVNVTDEFDFLGFSIRAGKKNKGGKYHLEFHPSEKAILRIKENVSQTVVSHEHSSEYNVSASLNAKLQGWGRYFDTVDSHDDMIAIDDYVSSLSPRAFPQGRGIESEMRGQQVRYRALKLSKRFRGNGSEI